MPNSTAKQTRHYTLALTTPAFLGNATQQPQWRTPPLKALLRQWWRVHWMARNGFPSNLQPMREAEALLFGHAWLNSGSSARTDSEAPALKSQVLLRLRPDVTASKITTGWQTGSQSGVGALPKGIETSYARFGLVDRTGANSKDKLPDRNAIKPEGAEGRQTLLLAAPASAWPELEAAFALVKGFGTLGSRCRGGWGSLDIPGVPALSAPNLQHHTQRLDTCLQRDWAAALAADEAGPCIWHSTQPCRTWVEAMTLIAKTRRDIRTRFEPRESYALGFASDGHRMSSPLRWKVVPTGETLQVRVFAMPHQIPEAGGHVLGRPDLHKTWEEVFRILQTDPAFTRIKL